MTNKQDTTPPALPSKQEIIMKNVHSKGEDGAGLCLFDC